jgi:hypothetical protein
LPPAKFDFLIDRGTYGISLICLLFFIYFILIFNVNQLKYKKIIFSFMILSCFWLILVFLGFVVGDRIYFNNLGSINSFDFVPTKSLLYLYISFIPYVIFIFWLLYLSIRNNKGIKKIQAKYIVIGIGGAIFITTLCNAFIPIFTRYFYKKLLFGWWIGIDGNIIQLVSGVFISIISLSIAYAITRYRFMDIRVVIKKTIIHFLSFLLLILIIASLILGTNQYLLQNFNLINIVIIEVILIVIFLPLLKKATLNIVNKYIDKDEIDLSKNIAEFNQAISYSNHLSDLVDKAKNFLRKELKVDKSDFVVRDFSKPELNYLFPIDQQRIIESALQNNLLKYFSARKELLLKQEIPYLPADKDQKKILHDLNKFLLKNNYCVVICLKYLEQTNGFIFLSGKTDSDAFSQEDVELLNSFISQVNIALYRVLSYEEAVARVKREFGPKI